jgi:uncharacterized membrane protein
MGAHLWRRQSGRSRGQLSRFLFTHGLWFVVLELTVMQFAYNFDFSSQHPMLLLILWIFGIFMIVMAAPFFSTWRWPACADS